MTHAPRHPAALLGLLAILVWTSAACERPVKPTPESTDADATPQADARADASGAEEASLDVQMQRAQGQSCMHDVTCPGYLRCIERVCATPLAITGEHDDRTPLATFRADRALESAEINRFYIELATDDEQRARGLMFRRSMKPDWGMLFIYPRDMPLSFWMKNTYIPLDMVFVNSAGRVMGVVEGAEPLTLSPRTVNKPARYVLELGAGVARERGIVEGAWMNVENAPRDDYRPIP